MAKNRRSRRIGIAAPLEKPGPGPSAHSPGWWLAGSHAPITGRTRSRATQMVWPSTLVKLTYRDVRFQYILATGGNWGDRIDSVRISLTGLENRDSGLNLHGCL